MSQTPAPCVQQLPVLSTATFCTFLREFSPPTAHRLQRRRIPVHSNGRLGGNACRFLAKPVRPSRTGDNGRNSSRGQLNPKSTAFN
jgi:hypothetical protein